jgi:hypothetical protein
MSPLSTQNDKNIFSFFFSFFLKKSYIYIYISFWITKWNITVPIVNGGDIAKIKMLGWHCKKDGNQMEQM